MFAKNGRNLKNNSNDVIYTPLPVALKMIDMCDIHENDKILDPSKGGGVFYNNFPNNCIKDYCEISEGIDFFNYNEKVLRFLQIWIEKCDNERQNTLNGTYNCGDHCKLIDSYNEIKDVDYVFISPMVASTNIQESMIRIGISPGGLSNESKK